MAAAYNFLVARGWESKSVEDQQAERASSTVSNKPRLTPQQQEQQRKKQGLLLSRQRILQQLNAATNHRHRVMLQAALDELEDQISHLG